jgi:hypothetical protein
MKTISNKNYEMAEEYDFSKAIRRKINRNIDNGYTVTLLSGEEENEAILSKEHFFKIDSDISDYFLNSEEINNALRAIIKALPKNKVTKSI